MITPRRSRLPHGVWTREPSLGGTFNVDRRHETDPPTEAPRQTAPRQNSADEVSPQSTRPGLLSLLLRPTPPPLALGLVVAASLIVAETLAVYPLKQIAPVNSLAGVYLLGVVLVSIVWGLGLAVATAVVSMVAFDYFYVPPVFEFTPTQPQDLVALGFFLGVAVSTSALAGLGRSRAVAVRAAERARVLAERQEALRRVATLVARGATTSEVFSAVATELARCAGVYHASLCRYEPDGTIVVLAAHNDPGLTRLPVGGRFSAEGLSAASLVWRTGWPARVHSYENAPGPTAARLRELGIRSGVGAPIIVDGRLWGVACVGSGRPEPMPPQTEARVADFAELVATAIANAAARDELRQLAEQQAALREVATLVARGVGSAGVFSAVAEQMARCLHVGNAAVCRFEGDEMAVVAVSHFEPSIENTLVVGERFPLEGDNLATRVFRTGRAALQESSEWHNASGPIAARLREVGHGCYVGVPIVVEGRVWGMASVGALERLPPDTEVRLGDFAELVATAIANAAARDELRELAQQQAALRRVATLVARGARPSEVYSAVADEIVECLDVDTSGVWRYESDNAITLLAGTSKAGLQYFPIGERLTIEGDNLGAMVLGSGRSARHRRFEHDTGSAIARIREVGIREGVGAPIIVEGRVWGLAIAATTRPEPLPPDTEERIGDFADLVATALANAATHDELLASRARIVAAADDARRRIERDLHDGAQQRLVSLGLHLRLAEDLVPDELGEVREWLSSAVSGVTALSSELQRLSRGIHPAIQSEGGLGPALKLLARRCPVPVHVEVTVKQRLPDPVEVAAYYVVAEALTNTAKYAHASVVQVCAEIQGANLVVSVEDDGIGGADPRNGSGLIGLKDRVEVLGGDMQITSPPGRGTSLRITIPIGGPDPTAAMTSSAAAELLHHKVLPLFDRDRK